MKFVLSFFFTCQTLHTGAGIIKLQQMTKWDVFVLTTALRKYFHWLCFN